MLDDSELIEIASRVAARSHPAIRDDVYQEAWLRFMRYCPLTRAGAWRMASSARNDLWRCEKRQQRLELMLTLSGPPPSSRDLRQARIRRYKSRHKDKILDRQRRYYWRHLDRERTASRDRVRRYRERQRTAQRGLVGG